MSLAQLFINRVGDIGQMTEQEWLDVVNRNAVYEVRDPAGQDWKYYPLPGAHPSTPLDPMNSVPYT